MRISAVLLLASAASLLAQASPYEIRIPADPPYYRVRYEASSKPGELIYPVSYTMWIPPGVKTLHGVVVHQHGCGEGSCKSGQTGAFDLHWQALAKKHACALLSPSYEQPEKSDCQKWCDPRQGSDAAFQEALADLGARSSHPELARVPWALWGHSGGASWSGAMVLLHPDRVAAAWLRSGAPRLQPAENRPTPFSVPDAASTVPVMCNLGTKEGVTVKDGRFAGVWPGVQPYFQALREKSGLIAVAVDPLTSHECGNQRYLAIPWLDACLAARLPGEAAQLLKSIAPSSGWVTPLDVESASVPTPIPATQRGGPLANTIWLPNEAIATAWTQYVRDTGIVDSTPPPAPTDLRVSGNELTWKAEADLESGLAGFIIERDGHEIARVPDQRKNPFGRPIFQGLQYSDTPTQPLVEMRYTDASVEGGHHYRVIAVNTVGLKSK